MLTAEAETIIEDPLAETSPAEAIKLDDIEQGAQGWGTPSTSSGPPREAVATFLKCTQQVTPFDGGHDVC